jgi:hypothetical protein
MEEEVFVVITLFALMSLDPFQTRFFQIHSVTSFLTANNPANNAAYNVQGDQKVSMHLMITIQKVTSNVPSVPRPSPDIY